MTVPLFESLRERMNPRIFCRIVVFILYAGAILSMSDPGNRTLLNAETGLGQLIEYLRVGIRDFGVIGFMFDSRFFFVNLVQKTWSYDQIVLVLGVASALGWTAFAVIYAQFIRNGILKELFILLILMFSLSYQIQRWNYLPGYQSISNIFCLYALIPIPYLIRRMNRYLTYFIVAIIPITLGYFTRQANMFYILSLIILYGFNAITMPEWRHPWRRVCIPIATCFLLLLFITHFTPTRNFSCNFDTILCARIFNPEQGFSLSIFKDFKKRYKERNIEYFRKHYGMDYDAMRANQPEPCRTNEVEYLINYKERFPESMFGVSASLYKGCCWYVTNQKIQDRIHKNAKSIYLTYLLDNWFYETALFFIESGGFVYAKSYFMEAFADNNTISHLFGNLLFAWTQPIMNAAVSTDEVNRDDRSNIKIRSWLRFTLLAPLPYFIFILGVSICMMQIRRTGKEALLSLFFLIFSMILSLLIVHFGNGMGFQRHAFWANVLFNLIVFMAYFLLLDAVVAKKT